MATYTENLPAKGENTKNVLLENTTIDSIQINSVNQNIIATRCAHTQRSNETSYTSSNQAQCAKTTIW